MNNTITFNSWDDVTDFTTNLIPNTHIDKLIIDLPPIDISIKTSSLVSDITETINVKYPLSLEITIDMNTNDLYAKWYEIVVVVFNNYNDNMDEVKRIIKTGIEADSKLVELFELKAMENYINNEY